MYTDLYWPELLVLVPAAAFITCFIALLIGIARKTSVNSLEPLIGPTILLFAFTLVSLIPVIMGGICLPNNQDDMTCKIFLQKADPDKLEVSYHWPNMIVNYEGVTIFEGSVRRKSLTYYLNNLDPEIKAVEDSRQQADEIIQSVINDY